MLGVVSEADLLAKKALADPGVFAVLVDRKDVRKAGGLTAGDLMTRPPVTASRPELRPGADLRAETAGQDGSH